MNKNIVVLTYAITYGGIRTWHPRVSYLTTYNYLTRPNHLGYPTTCIFPCFFITYKRGASQCEKLLVCDETRYSVIFAIADYEHELRIKKFKMAGAIWQTRIKKLLDLDKFGIA